MKRFPLFFCIPAKEKEWRKSPLFTLLEYAADYRRDLCLTDSLLYGHGRRLDVKADCLCKLCKGVMDGQRIRNLMVSPLTFTTAGSLPQSDTNRSTGT